MEKDEKQNDSNYGVNEKSHKEDNTQEHHEEKDVKSEQEQNNQEKNKEHKEHHKEHKEHKEHHKEHKEHKEHHKEHKEHKEHHNIEHKEEISGEKHSRKKDECENLDLWKAATIALAIILFIVIVNNSFSNNTCPSDLNSSNAEFVAANLNNLNPDLQKYKDDIGNGAMEGSKNAKIVVVEFSDFQCPFCEKFYSEAYKDLKKKYIDTGKVLFVYRNLPLPFHSHSTDAALAAECAKEQGKFWEYHNKLFDNQNALEKDDLKKYAKDIGLDTEKFNSCFDNKKYKDEVNKDLEYAQKMGLSGTPSFLINGVPLVGAQPLSAFESQFEALKNPINFNVYVINDKECATCSTDRLIQVTKQLFPTAKYINLDVTDDKAKKFIKDMDIKLAPALVFDKKMTETTGWKNNERIQPLFKKFGDYYLLDPTSIGATWIINKTEREKALQKTYKMLGLKKNDNMPQVDFFVMSFCPYGNQAEELLEPVYEKLKGKAKFNPRYVIYPQGSDCLEDSDGNKYCSMHGGQELHQDIRELCVYNDLGEDAWFKFALAMDSNCTASNADTCWVDVAKKLGLDVDKIKKCEEDKGLELVKREYELNKQLGVSGSPTVYIEGQQYNGARTSEGYMDALCNGFTNKPDECNNINFSNTNKPAAPTGSCG